ncbi:hypothetical protein R6Q57_009777 [Mikania cordata]
MEKGQREAEECGRRIREMIENDRADDWKVYFYVSPYLRTIETLRGLVSPASHKCKVATTTIEKWLQGVCNGYSVVVVMAETTPMISA